MKRGYYSFLDPALRRLKCEILDQTHLQNQSIKQEILDEVHRARQLDAELSANFTQKIADEIIRLNKVIDKLEVDHSMPKLPMVIVDELVKIHQSLERLSKN